MAGASGRPSLKTALVLGLKVVLSIALFGWLYGKVDWVNAENTIAHARVEWLVAAFLLLFTSNIGGARAKPRARPRSRPSCSTA